MAFGLCGELRGTGLPGTRLAPPGRRFPQGGAPARPSTGGGGASAEGRAVLHLQTNSLLAVLALSLQVGPLTAPLGS